MSPPRDPELDEFIDEPVPPVAPGAKRGPSVAPMPSAPPRSGAPTWLIVVAIVGVVGLALIGVLASLAIYGVRRYIWQAQLAEGRNNVTVFAQGVTHCFAESERLPETSPRVPADLALIAAKKYQSAPDDWSHETFRCAEFSLREPQYFQYQWVLAEGTQAGNVVAIADLNGDGDPEVRLELDVDCSGEACQLGQTMREVSPMAREQR